MKKTKTNILIQISVEKQQQQDRYFVGSISKIQV